MRNRGAVTSPKIDGEDETDCGCTQSVICHLSFLGLAAYHSPDF
jgi:hypothetical protein